MDSLSLSLQTPFAFDHKLNPTLQKVWRIFKSLMTETLSFEFPQFRR